MCVILNPNRIVAADAVLKVTLSHGRRGRQDCIILLIDTAVMSLRLCHVAVNAGNMNR